MYANLLKVQKILWIARGAEKALRLGRLDLRDRRALIRVEELGRSDPRLLRLISCALMMNHRDSRRTLPWVNWP
jgi:hypothetical protein